jgi:lipoprotein-releasing system ATP-binding protein
MSDNREDTPTQQPKRSALLSDRQHDGGPPRQHDASAPGSPRAPLHVAAAGQTMTTDWAHATTGPHLDAPTEQLAAVGLTKSYRKGPIEVPVLKGLDLAVRRGEFVAIVGQSGCGKSTLLHLLGTLDAPDAGEVYFQQQRIDNLPAAARDGLRDKNLGMIFQFYHLLPELNTLENVLMPLMIAHSTLGYLRHRRRHRQAATELLDMVGLGHRLKHRPRELSGGEMQRVAVARALVAGPELLLADEPTGNLDRDSGRDILATLRTLNQQQGLTIVMVTHDQAIADQADRVVRLADGRIKG